MDNITPYFFDSLEKVIEGNTKSRQNSHLLVMSLQLDTLTKLNGKMIEQYKVTQNKVKEIDNNVQLVGQECKAVEL